MDEEEGPGATDGAGRGVGLGPDGTILREGALERVQPEYAALLDAARARILAAFPPDRLHSAYLYGSVPRGTARPGRSDLDLLLALHHPPAPADRAAADALAAGLDADFAVVDGVGPLLYDTGTLLSDLERYDLGFFVACLCTPLLGPDLAAALPRYRPDALLARETNGDLALALPGWRERAATSAGEAERRALCRGVARRVVRSGFTLVMPRWGGWTSALPEQAAAFAGYYPARGTQMRRAAGWALAPTGDPAALELLVEDLAPWLAATYTAVHGEKTPRPAPAGGGRGPGAGGVVRSRPTERCTGPGLSAGVGR